MIINLHIYEVPADDFSRGYFLAESPQLCISTNCPELSGEPIEFYGDTRHCVLDQVRAFARAKFGSGVIRISK